MTKPTGRDHLKEARRRAEILRRYDSVPSRTEEDDRSFAAEIGVAVETLHQLVRSWRRHHDPRRLPGARTRITNADRQAAIAAASNPDMSKVDPARRPLVRRRLGVIREYIASPDHPRKRKAMFAAKLEMSTCSFDRLVREWIMDRNPQTLLGGSTPTTLKDRRNPKIGNEAETCIASVIENMGPEASTIAIYHEVVSRCQKRGIPVPSQGSVYSRTVRTRGSSPVNDISPMMAVDHVALNLIVEQDGSPNLPVLSVLLEFPSGHIVQHSLSLDPPSPESTAKLLATSLGRTSSHQKHAVPLELAIPRDPRWRSLSDILNEGTDDGILKIRNNILAGRSLGRITGQHFGRLKMRRNATSNPAKSKLPKLGRLSSPISFKEASEAIEEIVREHNRTRPSSNSTFATGPNGNRIRKRLIAI